MRPLHVVVVDDDPNIGLYLREVFTAEGHVCHTFHAAEPALAHVSANGADLAMIDIYLGQSSGLDVARSIRELHPDVYAVVMTAHISLETAARSVAEGVIEYVSKPLGIDQLKQICVRADAYRKRAATPEPVKIEPPQPRSAIIGRSPRMLEVYTAISRVAPSDATVLITGASGTGKELVARALHRYSARAAQPFIPVNCGSFTETILESELFGHEKGAFTGASSVHRGLLESAYGGTLFLDEVTETTLGFQVKLLRAIQEQQVRRVGSNKYTSINVRILAATNRDPIALIRQGLFREDLYYRLSVVEIVLPALRDRREDIPLLVAHFLAEFNQRNENQVAIDVAAVERLQWMEWPGNVRELENTVNRLAIFAPAGRISLADVEREAARTTPIAAAPAEPVLASGRLVDVERQQIVRTLRECGGNKAEAARRLGIERKTLYKKALRLGINLQSVKDE